MTGMASLAPSNNTSLKTKEGARCVSFIFLSIFPVHHIHLSFTPSPPLSPHSSSGIGEWCDDGDGFLGERPHPRDLRSLSDEQPRRKVHCRRNTATASHRCAAPRAQSAPPIRRNREDVNRVKEITMSRSSSPRQCQTSEVEGGVEGGGWRGYEVSPENTLCSSFCTVAHRRCAPPIRRNREDVNRVKEITWKEERG